MANRRSRRMSAPFRGLRQIRRFCRIGAIGGMGRGLLRMMIECGRSRVLEGDLVWCHGGSAAFE